MLVAACGGSGVAEELSVDAYVDEMNRINAEFLAAAPDVPSILSGDAYPVDGEMVAATDLFQAIEDQIRGMRAITPPSGALAGLHAEMIAAGEDVQELVREYMAHSSIEGDFEFFHITALPGFAAADSRVGAACLNIKNLLYEESEVTAEFPC